MMQTLKSALSYIHIDGFAENLDFISIKGPSQYNVSPLACVSTMDGGAVQSWMKKNSTVNYNPAKILYYGKRIS